MPTDVVAMPARCGTREPPRWMVALATVVRVVTDETSASMASLRPRRVCVRSESASAYFITSLRPRRVRVHGESASAGSLRLQ